LRHQSVSVDESKSAHYGQNPAPDGFTRRDTARGTLYAAAGDEAEIVRWGLDGADAWDVLLSTGDAGTGRGASAVLPRAQGPAWRLKRMRRGGFTARFWRDRYPSARRLVAMLAASGEARRRGVATPRAVALLVERDAFPLVRAFLATEEIEGAEDLARRARRGALTSDDVVAAKRAVGLMHDAGMDHPDLNLGNILLAPDGVHVVDLDRVTFTSGPLPDGKRARALSRLARSCAKMTGPEGPWS
jgi:3-deoxy-D-manno-octulosonic acid kinase